MKNIIEDIYPLSPMQQGMLFHTLQAPGSGVYVEQMSCTLQGNLDVRAFKQAWQRLLDRHSVLRTAFDWSRRQEPFQIVYRRARLVYEELDWQHLAASEQSDHLERFLQNDRELGIDLSKAPAMRLTLIHAAADRYVFVWSIHHIVIDGWSMPLLFKEVFTLYEDFRHGREVTLPRPRPYGDYVAWLQRQEMAEAERFWRKALAGFTAPTSFPIDRSEGAGAMPKRTASQELYLSEKTTNELQSLAREHKLTMNVLVQAAWASRLSYYSGEQDIVFGAAVSGRPADLPGVESMMGLFINTLPVRVRISPDERFVPWLKELQGQQVEARKYEYSPLVEIQGWSDVPRGVPLFESILVFENYPVGEMARENNDSVQVNDVRIVEQTNYPLALMIAPGSRLSMRLDYDARRFDQEIVESIVRHLGILLENIAAHPERHLRDISALSDVERHTLIFAWNDTEATYPRDACLHEVFEGQAQRTPDATALIFEGARLTYQELNQRSNRLTHHLRLLGVGPESMVGVCAERSPETVIGLLAVLKAGGAFVCLDPSYPTERLQFMLDDADVPVLLTQSKLVEMLPKSRARVVLLDAELEDLSNQSTENPISGALATHPAYIIYTSGSTGIPKGVVGPHRGALNRFQWMWERYPFGAHEVCSQKTSLSFVDSIWEIFGPLLRGVPTVIISDAALQDPQRLITSLASHHVSRILLVPSLLNAILRSSDDLQLRLPELKYWISSGEALSPELYQLFSQRLPSSILINLYGTSEVAADATCYDPSDDDPSSPVSIGQPIANMQAYVVDNTQFQPLPVGVTGELYIGGDGLARGYHNRPELTAERFIPDPFSRRDGARLYRTGDLARRRADGNLEFVGRADQQVKVRGFRIELGEVAATLNSHPEVSNAIVIAREEADGDQRLAAYVVAKETANTPDLRGYLKQRLPEHMVPSNFVMLDSFPLLPNGKIDRKALPMPGAIRAEILETFEAPQTDTERTVAAIWAEVLGVDEIGANDNFFELGGHSLMVMQVLSRLRASFGIDLALPDFFAVPTVRGLAETVENAMFTNAGAVKIDEMLDLLGTISDDKAQSLLRQGQESEEL